RQSLISASVDSDSDRIHFRQHIARAVQEAGGGTVRYLEWVEPLWRSAEVPEQVGKMLQSLRLPAIKNDLWKQMGEEKRFAILRLTRHGHARNLEPALRGMALT